MAEMTEVMEAIRMIKVTVTMKSAVAVVKMVLLVVMVGVVKGAVRMAKVTVDNTCSIGEGGDGGSSEQ